MKALLDTAAFLNHASVDFSLFSRLYTTPMVVEEVKDKISKMVLESLDVSIVKPKKENMKTILKLIKDYGFLELLSKTDVELLAAAFELRDAVVLTDDKSIENILSILKIPFRTMVREPIKNVIKNPRFKCISCGRLNNSRYCKYCGAKCRVINQE